MKPDKLYSALEFLLYSFYVKVTERIGRCVKQDNVQDFLVLSDLEMAQIKKRLENDRREGRGDFFFYSDSSARIPINDSVEYIHEATKMT